MSDTLDFDPSKYSSFQLLPEEKKKSFAIFKDGFVQRDAFFLYIEARSSLIVGIKSIFSDRSVAILDYIREENEADFINELGGE